MSFGGSLNDIFSGLHLHKFGRFLRDPSVEPEKVGSERDPSVRDKVLGEFHHYTPQGLTWNLKMMVSKRNLIYFKYTLSMPFSPKHSPK